MAHKDVVTTLTVLKDNNVISGSLDTTLRLWDITSGKCLRKFIGHTHAIMHIHELKNGNIVSSSLDKTIIIWNR